jgi:hypothetical protein
MVEVPREEVYHDEELVHIPPNPKNFWIIKKLGEGIFGTVFLAIEKINEFRRRFAVKRIKVECFKIYSALMSSAVIMGEREDLLPNLKFF